MRYWIILSISLLSFSYTQAQVNFNVASAEVQEGESFCLDLTVEGFTEILSTQLRVIWDSTLLQFDTTINLGVESNGLVFASKVDELRFTWFANDFFAGETLDSGAVLFSVCFTSLKIGEVIVEIDENMVGNPLAPEISNLADGVLSDLTFEKGTVHIRTETEEETNTEEGTGTTEEETTDTEEENNTSTEEENNTTMEEENNTSTEEENNTTTEEENSTSTEEENNTAMEEENATDTPSGGSVESIACQAVEISIERTICQGDNYEGYLESGDYKDTYTTAGGCDSIVNLTLVVMGRVMSEVNTSICPGGEAEGYTSKGSYIDVFTSSIGCDSIRILNLFILAEDDTDCSTTTSVIDLEEDPTFLVHPNPVQHEVQIQLNQGSFTAGTISLFNIHGQLQLSLPYTQKNLSIPTHQLPQGMYILSIEMAEATYVKQLLKL